jgi:hypothetical protein
LSTHLKVDVLIANPDLEFLLAVLVLLWPFLVVFPVILVRESMAVLGGHKPYFMISLDLMILLISSIIKELTYTASINQRSAKQYSHKG